MLLLSRFWYLILAAVAAIAVAAALLAQGIINRQSDSQVESQLRRDRVELDAMLSLEARRRMDSIAFVTVEPKIAGVLRRAAAISDVGRLGKLNAEEAPSLAAHHAVRSIPTLVVFRDGREVARQLGAMSRPQLVRWIRANVG